MQSASRAKLRIARIPLLLVREYAAGVDPMLFASTGHVLGARRWKVKQRGGQDRGAARRNVTSAQLLETQPEAAENPPRNQEKRVAEGTRTPDFQNHNLAL